MLAANPSLTVNQVKAILQESAEDWGAPGQDIDYGWGRLDAYRAIARAGNFSDSGAPAVPGHLAFTGNLAAGGSVEHSFLVSDTSVPISLTLLMPGAGSSPDFDLYLYNPAGQEIGRSTGASRQELITANPSQVGTYRARVRSYAGAGTYRLDISAGTAGAGDLAPTIAFAAPAEGATLAGVVEILVQASDDRGVGLVELAVDAGAYQNITGQFDGTYYRATWDTGGVANGAHTLRGRVTDTAGQQSQAERQVIVANSSQPREHLWSRTGQVSSSAKDQDFILNVAEPGFVDLTLSWAGTADLDFYVYAPDGALVGRAFTLRNPERLRLETPRTGAYRVRVNLYGGPTTSFTLTAAGFQAMDFTGNLSPTNRNVTHIQPVAITGPSRVVLGWPGSSDLDFFVTDPTGRERARGYSWSNPEMKEFALDVTGEWAVRVNLYSGQGATYTLQWFVPAPVLN